MLCQVTPKPPSNPHLCCLQGGVHGEEQTPAGAAQRAEDGDRKPEAEGERDAAGHHPQPECRAGDQQAEQLQEGGQATCGDLGLQGCRTVAVCFLWLSNSARQRWTREGQPSQNRTQEKTLVLKYCFPSISNTSK